MDLGARDLRIVLDAIDAFYASETLEEFATFSREALARVVAAEFYDITVFATRAPEVDLYLGTPDRFTADEINYQLANYLKHPVPQLFDERRDTGTLPLSHIVPVSAWRSSEFYAESGSRRMRLDYELNAILPGASHTGVGALSIFRTGRDFSLRDCQAVHALRSHLGRALRLMLARNQPASPARWRGIFPALSPREAEVLHWMTEGKLNAEIATILEIRLVTVQEHVESVLRKLAQENRHAATVFALASLHRTAGKSVQPVPW